MTVPQSPSSRRHFLAQLALAGAAAHASLSGAGDAPVSGADEADQIVRRIRPPQFGPGRANLGGLLRRDGGDIDCRPQLQQAIDELARTGGGRVTVPPGRWRMNGPITMRDRVELHLVADARLVFDADPERYLPMVLTRWEGTECYNYSPFIYAWQASHIGITGAGVIDGNAKESFGSWKPRQGEAQLRLRELGGRGAPVHERRFGRESWLRPSFIQFMGCRHVLIEGVTIVDSPFWCVHPVYSQHVIMRNTTVRAANLNNDGIDPDSSQLVLVERCTFETGDDAVAIKSGRDADGWRVGVPSRDIVIRDCRMPSVWNGICIGSEMSGGVHDVHVARCTIGTTRSALLFKGNLDRGGAITRVRVKDMTVEQATTLLEFTTSYQGYRGGQAPPTFRDFAVSHLRCSSTSTALRLVGDAAAPLQDVRLADVTVARAERPLEMAHADGVRGTNVRINGRAVTLPTSAGPATPPSSSPPRH